MPEIQPNSSVETAIVALVDALVESKGWTRAYADAVVRGAVDRQARAYVPLTDSEIEACMRESMKSLGKSPTHDSGLAMARDIEAAVRRKMSP